MSLHSEPPSVDSIHDRAKEIAFRYKRTEVELIDILQQVDEHRVFLKHGYSSLFSYVTTELGISENVTYNLISIARKSREVPELKLKLESGSITLSNARRIVPVLTVGNQKEWISKASELSNRKLEKEVSRVMPEIRTPERASYVSPNRIKLELGISEIATLRLRRAQDLLCQKYRRSVSLEETLESLTTEFLRRNDPIEKAKRHPMRKVPVESKKSLVQLKKKPVEPKEFTPQFKNTPVEPKSAPNELKKIIPTQLLKTLVTRRVPLAAHTLHQVNLRDQRRCVFTLPSGDRCNQSRWIEIHHKIPVSEGGTNELKNLITLCSSHHDLEHMRLESARRVK